MCFREARLEYGDTVAKSLRRKIASIESAASVRDLFQFGKFHQLVGDRAGQYAFNLTQKLRLVVDLQRATFDEESAQQPTVSIVEIVDYHGE